MHADGKNRRCFVAMLFIAGDLRRYKRRDLVKTENSKFLLDFMERTGPVNLFSGIF